MHYFILYQWDASGNSSANAAFAESRRAATAAHVGSTQVCILPACTCLAGWLAYQMTSCSETLNLCCRVMSI